MHLRAVSRAAFQGFGILRKSWQVFHDRLLLWRCFRGFVLPVLECHSAGRCSVVDTHFKLLDRVVSFPIFVTGGVFECDVAHRRSVAVSCMLYNIRHNQIHPLYGALPGTCVPVRLHAVLWSYIGTLRCLLAADPRSTAGLWFSCQYLCGTILVTSYSMVWDCRVSRTGPMPFYWRSCSIAPFWFTVFAFSSFILWVGIVGVGFWTDRCV